MKRILGLAVVLAAMGCGVEGSASTDGGGGGGGGGGSQTETVSVAFYASNSMCRSPLYGGTSAGGSCGTGQDCVEVCCSCTTGSKQFSAQVCVNDKCADKATACAKAMEKHSNLCN